MSRVAALAAVLALISLGAGCGGHRTRDSAQPVVSSRAWIAVINDALDNARLDESHSCGAEVEAVAQLKRTQQPRELASVITDGAKADCTASPRLGDIQLGMTDGTVAELAGMPATIDNACWLYRASSGGLRVHVCFARHRVVFLREN